MNVPDLPLVGHKAGPEKLKKKQHKTTKNEEKVLSFYKNFKKKCDVVESFFFVKKKEGRKHKVEENEKKIEAKIVVVQRSKRPFVEEVKIGEEEKHRSGYESFRKVCQKKVEKKKEKKT